MIAAIAAVSRNFGIGKDNDLLYNIPEDKKYFRRMTLGKTVVMGRKTLESLPNSKPFKDRRNIVLSKNEGFAPEGAEVCRSTEELNDLIKTIDEDIFIVGGAEIYSLLLPCCDTEYITKIDDEAPADKFFPNIDNDTQWTMTEASEEYEFEGIKYKFCTYKRAGIHTE